MEYRIKPNHKDETFTRTAFLEQIAAYSPAEITIIVNRFDLIDPDAPVNLDNIKVPAHHCRLVDSIIYMENDMDITQGSVVIYERSKG